MATISRLATSQYITSKCHNREGNDIRFIIPHHMAGRATGAACAYYFVANTVGTSANYCIGYDGDISCNVPQEYAAFTSGSQPADKRSITIECSDESNSSWVIPDKTVESLINLMVDLIQRYPSLGGKAVFDPTDEARVIAAKSGKGSWDVVKGNIIYHEWTSLCGTPCPHWHMKQIMPEIVAEVNKRLAEAAPKEDTEPAPAKTTRELAQEVIDGKWSAGKTRMNMLKKAGYDYTTVQNEVDLMLAKNLTANIDCFIKSATYVKKGVTGQLALVLQKALNKMGYFKGTFDGIVGNITEKAIKDLQKAWKIGADGIFGPKSWTKLLK